jgi:hypothetical protein
MDETGRKKLTPAVMKQLIKLDTIESIVKRSEELSCPISEDTARRIIYMEALCRDLEENPPDVHIREFVYGENPD